MNNIYLDYAAATPLDEQVEGAMRPFWRERFYNASATYLAAQEVGAAIGEARALVAHWLGARPAEVVFAAGGTEADNLAIHGVMRAYPEGKLVVSAVEHEAILQAAAQYDHTLAPVDGAGLVDLAKLEGLIDDQTVLVSVMQANNEVGTIQPIAAIGHMIKQLRDRRKKAGNSLPLYFHTDASQAANYLDVHASRLGVDLLTLNGGKIYGPKQTGALFVKGGVRLQPLIRGGGQESGLRAGTENVPGIVGFAAALDQAQTMREHEGKRLQGLQRLFIKELTQIIPSIVFNGSLKHRLPNNVHVTIPGCDNERLVMQLDEAGIMCAAGSACTASNDEPSHVLKAMGLSDADAQSSMRFTMGRFTTEDEVLATVKALSVIVKS